MLFVSIPVRPNVTPSDLFKEKGNTSDMPCPVSESPIIGIKRAEPNEYKQFEAYYEYHVAAVIANAKIQVVNTQYFDIGSFPAEEFLPPPPVGITFPNATIFEFF